MSKLTRLVCLLSLAVAARAFQAPAAAPAPAKGAIEGQVVNGRTGTPLKRAMVRVAGTVPQTPGVANAAQGGRGGPPVRPVLINKETDEQGRFSIANLEPGKYRVTAERQGFLRQNWGARKYSGGSAQVLVGEGQTVKQIDFRLMPQGVITGKVLDEDGEPMAGVQVRAQRTFLRNGLRVSNTVANATTSDIGEYRLPELKPGRYSVVAFPRPRPDMMGMGPAAPSSLEPLPANPEMTYAATFYPSTPDAATAVPVDVGEGAEVPQVDIRLMKSRVFRVRGKVIGLPEGGAGRRGGGMIPVTLIPKGGTRGEMIPMGQARGPEGVFEIRNVPAGQYTAQAISQVGGAQYVALTPVDVIGSHADGVVLQMASGGDVQGSVKVVDGTAELTNVQVSLRPVGFGGQAPRARVAEDLKFTLKGVPPVNYAVSVSGYPDSCYVKSIQYGGADVSPEGVAMTNGGVIEVVLSAAAATVDVVVTAGDSKAGSGAQVAVMKDGTLESVRTADESGMLSLKGLKPGSYRLIAWEDVDPDLLWDPDYVKKFENEGKGVKLDASGHEAIQLKAIPAQ
jgi:Carboxypeptidase regulatory-like domain